ncbi:hypothetical protein FBZ99_105440 [Rhizobium sp. ERR 1071]|nr:hypothetical protein FBZ99_105440 [Rhizobium sp. ERR1071]
MQTVTGLYDSYDNARTAVKALEDAGVASDEISIITNKADGVDVEGQGSYGAEGAGTGAGIGAVAGGAGGLLGGLGMIAIPGVGPVVAAGWLAATAAGAIAGAVAGGAVGGDYWRDDHGRHSRRGCAFLCRGYSSRRIAGRCSCRRQSRSPGSIDPCRVSSGRHCTTARELCGARMDRL